MLMAANIVCFPAACLDSWFAEKGLLPLSLRLIV